LLAHGGNYGPFAGGDVMIIGKAYYKFLDRDDVNRVLNDGTVLISSLEYYRGLEKAAWGLIADRLEGASEMIMPDHFTITENSPELEMINNSGAAKGSARKLAHVESGGRINLGGATFVRVLPGHVYCASYGSFDELHRYYTVEAERKYNACLRITSFRRLARRIFRTGVILGTKMKFSDVFDRVAIDTVTYEARSRSINEGPMLEESPFKKELVFKPQQEVRIYFVAKDGLRAEDRIVVRIEDPSSIFSKMPF
jgi:hypothetical protein